MMLRKLILLGLLLLTLAGCLGTTQRLPAKPIKPKLSMWENSLGGVCLSRDDTQKLLTYIYQLEEGYE
jgi:hypothetical protein